MIATIYRIHYTQYTLHYIHGASVVSLIRRRTPYTSVFRLHSIDILSEPTTLTSHAVARLSFRTNFRKVYAKTVSG